MKGILFTFRSITTAQRGEELLKSRGIDAVLRRTPRKLGEQGCGYCLTVEEPSGGRAAALMRKYEIPFRRSFRVWGEDTVEVRL